MIPQSHGPKHLRMSSHPSLGLQVPQAVARVGNSPVNWWHINARAIWRAGVGESWNERLLGHRSPLHPLWFPFVHFHRKGWSVYGCTCWPGTYGHSKSISIGSIPIQGSCRLYGCKEDAKAGRVSLWLCVPSRIHGPWGENAQGESIGSAGRA